MRADPRQFIGLRARPEVKSAAEMAARDGQTTLSKFIEQVLAEKLQREKYLRTELRVQAPGKRDE
jgi:hypothetical protein